MGSRHMTKDLWGDRILDLIDHDWLWIRKIQTMIDIEYFADMFLIDLLILYLYATLLIGGTLFAYRIITKIQIVISEPIVVEDRCSHGLALVASHVTELPAMRMYRPAVVAAPHWHRGIWQYPSHCAESSCQKAPQPSLTFSRIRRCIMWSASCWKNVLCPITAFKSYQLLPTRYYIRYLMVNLTLVVENSHKNVRILKHWVEAFRRCQIISMRA